MNKHNLSYYKCIALGMNNYNYLSYEYLYTVHKFLQIHTNIYVNSDYMYILCLHLLENAGLHTSFQLSYLCEIFFYYIKFNKTLFSPSNGLFTHFLLQKYVFKKSFSFLKVTKHQQKSLTCNKINKSTKFLKQSLAQLLIETSYEYSHILYPFHYLHEHNFYTSHKSFSCLIKIGLQLVKKLLNTTIEQSLVFSYVKKAHTIIFKCFLKFLMDSSPKNKLINHLPHSLKN